MQCYKCGEKDTSKLSLKKQQRGIMTFVCRQCRNASARAWRVGRVNTRREYTDIDPEAWNKWASDTRQRIAANYEARRAVV